MLLVLGDMAMSYQRPSDETIKAKLTPLQYRVTQKDGTEPPFKNAYWDNEEEGIYVDVVSGEPLFSSTDKYKSGTGWPSFTKPLAPENIVLKEDRKLFSVRTEVRSKHGNSHLGHVFDDGPAPTGKRYCMNSAALRFIPVGKMDEEGYGEYKTALGAVEREDWAIFAGGCFWCMESPFEKTPGVIEVISGYTGGKVENPSYKQVSSGTTGHVEAIKVVYDPSQISYESLLDIFWKNIDPTDSGGQFVDRGEQYRAVIFPKNKDERDKALESKRALEKSGRFKKPIVTEIIDAQTFYNAEDYHQDYYKKNPIRYKYYRYRSGRDQFLSKNW